VTIPTIPEPRDTPAPEDLSRILLDDRVKGIPAGIRPIELGEIRNQGWNLLREDLPLPAAALRQSAIEHNSRWMQGFLSRTGAAIAPHGKTTMAPQLFHRQLADGAWGITVATPQQLQVCRHYGIRRVLLANQLVSRGAVDHVAREMERDEDFEFYCFVDSLEGVELLARRATNRATVRPIQLLIEVGFAGGRTGVRTPAAALQLGEAIAAAGPSLQLRGVSGFEGLIPGGSPPDTTRRVTDFLDRVVESAEALEERGSFAPGTVILSAGGSAYFDLVTRRFSAARVRSDRLVLIRSGCYLTHDSRMYEEQFRHATERSPVLGRVEDGLRAAVELWAYVQSRPEPNRAILGLGKRDCSYDAGLPRPLSWYRPGTPAPLELPGRHEIVELNDQHAFLDLPAESPLRFGDMVMLGISHPCTTFDKWQLLLVVDDHYRVVDGIRTFF
jgi:D-serine dehydratase